MENFVNYLSICLCGGVKSSRCPRMENAPKAAPAFSRSPSSRDSRFTSKSTSRSSRERQGPKGEPGVAGKEGAKGVCGTDGRVTPASINSSSTKKNEHSVVNSVCEYACPRFLENLYIFYLIKFPREPIGRIKTL